MLIEIRVDGVLARYSQGLDSLSAKARLEIGRGLARGGEKLRTPVRHALKAQTSVKRYGTIVAKTRGWLDAGALAYTIEASGKGLPLDEFPFRASRSKRLSLRWSRREHWRLQGRDGAGRFGPLPEVTDSGVRATMWGASHAFKRSFAHPDRGPVMQREAGKRPLRKLFGPSLPKELLIGKSSAAFKRGATTLILPEIEKRLARLVPGV